MRAVRWLSYVISPFSNCGLQQFERDATLERTPRKGDVLTAIGEGATLIFPSGEVIDLSHDYPRAQRFAPDRIR